MSKEKEKITEQGQLCRHCDTPVVKRIPKEQPRGERKFYFEFFFFCPGCKRNYLVESAKRFWSEKSALQGASPASSERSNEELPPPESDFQQK